MEHNPNFTAAHLEDNAVEMRPSEAIEELVLDLDSKTLWSGLDVDWSRPMAESTLNSVHAFIRRKDQANNHAISETRRKMELRFLVRALVFKSAAETIPGYLENLLSEAEIKIAPNAKTPQRGLNAAVARFLAAKLNNPLENKYRITRSAQAIVGIERFCVEKGIELSFTNADAVFEAVRGMSRTKLCEIADAVEAPVQNDPPDCMGEAPFRSSAQRDDKKAARPAPAKNNDVPQPTIVSEIEVDEDHRFDPFLDQSAPLDALPVVATMNIEQSFSENPCILLGEFVDGCLTLRGPLFVGVNALQLVEQTLRETKRPGSTQAERET